MPLASRREEIDRFLEGRAEVCAATDVLGHGVNLPCETLLFAETTKFDGRERRDLLPWEIAQIAGRAGRFGFHERGHVGVLTGVPWADPDPQLVRDALTPHVELPGGHRGYRVVDSGRLRPQLSDLNVTAVDELEPALHAWRQAALRYWSVDGWLEVESIQPLLARLDAARDALHHSRRRLELADVWKLMQAPIDEDGLPLLGTLAAALAGDRPQRTVLGWLLDPHRLDAAGLEEAEQAAREASILRWFALQYPGVAGVTIERAAALEEAAARRVVRELRAEIDDPDDRPLPCLRRPHRAVGDALRPLLHGPRLSHRPSLTHLDTSLPDRPSRGGKPVPGVVAAADAAPPGFGHARRMTQDQFRVEHDEFRAWTDELRAAARILPDLDAGARLALVADVVAFLQEKVEPHTHLDEQVLYPKAGARMGSPLATAAMAYDHLAIRAWIAKLAEVDEDGRPGPSRSSCTGSTP